MNAQLKKGALELCVLAKLQNHDRYGYELTDEISKKMDIATGTLYLVLKRLKDDDFVTTYLQESENGPARKYYSITEAGREFYEEAENEWLSFVSTVNSILEEEKND